MGYIFSFVFSDYNQYMKFLIIFSLCFSVQSYAIDLIIGGKTYYIKKFEIKEDGKTIVIPYTIHLSEAAFKKSESCESNSQSKRSPANSNSSVRESGGKLKAKQHPFNQLMQDLDGQYKSLSDQLRIKRKKRTRSKRNFR